MLELTLPIKHALDRYLVDCRRRGLREPTIHYCDTAVRRFARGDRTAAIADLNRDSARCFQDESPTLSAGSMRGYIRALRTFSTWLFSEGLLPDDPLANLALPRVDRKLVLVPSDEEILDLLDVTAPALRVVIAVLAGTGLRISDICGLDLPDLKGDRLLVRTTKNRAGRVVPLDDVLATVLPAYVADLRVGSRADERDALFLSRTGRRLTPSAARLALTAAARRSNLSMPVSPHVFRHWFARDLAAHGTTDRLLTARMGWTSPSLVERYAPVSDAELVADTARYSPLHRLADGGMLRRRLPSTIRARGTAPRDSKRLPLTSRSRGRTE
jgi:site-specific recombinase XerD